MDKQQATPIEAIEPPQVSVPSTDMGEDNSVVLDALTTAATTSESAGTVDSTLAHLLTADAAASPEASVPASEGGSWWDTLLGGLWGDHSGDHSGETSTSSATRLDVVDGSMTEAGSASLGLSSASQVKEGDKVTASDSYGVNLSASQDLSEYSAGYSGTQTRVDEDGNSQTLNASLGYDATTGVSGEAGKTSQTVIGDSSWDRSASLSYQDGTIGGALGEGSHVVDTVVYGPDGEAITTTQDTTRGVSASYSEVDGMAAKTTSLNSTETVHGDQVVTSSAGVDASYEKGSASVGLSSASQVKEGDKVTASDSYGVNLSASQDLSEYSAGYTGTQTRVDEDGNSQTLNASLGYDAKTGVSGEAGKTSQTVIGDSSWDKSASLSYQDGTIGGALGEGSHVVDTLVYGPDGEAVRTTQDTERGVSASYGGEDGLTVFASGSEANQSTVLDANGDVSHQVSTSNDGSIGLTKGVVQAGLSESREVIDGQGDEQTTTASKRGITGDFGSNEEGELVGGVGVSGANTYQDSKGNSSSTTGALSYGTDGLSGQVDTASITKLDDGTLLSTRHASTVGYDDERGLTAYTSRAEGAATDVGSGTTTAGVGMKDGSFAADVTSDRNLSIDADHSLKDSTSIGFANGTLTAGTASSSTSINENGRPIGSTTNATVGLSENGLTTGYSVGDSVTNRDNSKSTTSTSGSANLSTGELTGGYQSANLDASGHATSSVGATGTLDLGQNGLDGVSGSLSASKGNVNVAVFGSYKVTTSEPVQQGATWTVSWSRQAAAGASGGGSEKVSAGASGTSTASGTQVFASQAEASAWYASPQFPDLPATADAALEMAEGEVLSDADAVEANLRASGNVGAVTFGAGVKVG
jgi:hypothetical protein